MEGNAIRVGEARREEAVQKYRGIQPEGLTDYSVGGMPRVHEMDAAMRRGSDKRSTPEGKPSKEAADPDVKKPTQEGAKRT